MTGLLQLALGLAAGQSASQTRPTKSVPDTPIYTLLLAPEPPPSLSTLAAFILILRRQNQRFETLIQNAVNSGYCSSSSEPERRLYDVI